MKILITGGTGFLGKHVKDALTLSSHLEMWAPSSQELDVLLQDCTQQIVKYKPDIILHMAARCGGILANKNSPADFLSDNTQMGLNIYKAALKCNVKYVYSLGSVCAYPKYCPIPFKEGDIWNGAAEETNFPYGQAKRTLLMLSQTYRQQYGIGGAHLIPVNMYGEYDNFDLTNSHVIPALIHKFDRAISGNLTTVECWGSGTATREFLFVKDCARAIVKAITTNLDTDLPINLGTGQDISILELSSIIAELMAYKGEIKFTGDVSDGQPKRMLDVSRAKKLLGWEATTKLHDGLQQTIQWYRDNKHSI